VLSQRRDQLAKANFEKRQALKRCCTTSQPLPICDASETNLPSTMQLPASARQDISVGNRPQEQPSVRSSTRSCNGRIDNFCFVAILRPREALELIFQTSQSPEDAAASPVLVDRGMHLVRNTLIGLY